ncbi:MAG TPA: choice-of-anchor D domain-containing protein [Polyangiaceae bacterium]|nr:choice-of-anchor D domain-containing protein [Polyangiaceae bacterium]
MIEILRFYCTRIALVAGASFLLAAQCSDASLTVSPGDAIFEPTIVGETSSRTFTVTNSGAADAILGPITEQGLQLDEPFLVSGGTCVTGGVVRAGGGTCTLVLDFSPTAGGSESYFRVRYNWEGSGVDVRVATGHVSGSVPGLSSTSGAFGNVALGETETKTLTVINANGIAAQIESVTFETRIVGPDQPFPVRITGGTCAPGSTIASRGGTCTVQLAFTPLQTLSQYGYVVITYRWPGAARSDRFAAIVDGVGVVGFELTADRPHAFSPDVVTEPGFEFGALSVGSASIKQFWITNRQQQDVLLHDLTTLGLGLTAPFELIGGSCLTAPLVSRGGQCSLHVRFSPTELAPVADSIAVRYEHSGMRGVLSRGIAGSGATPDPVQHISAAGGDHTCALLESGNVRCWGDSSNRQLGYANVLYSLGGSAFPNSAGDLPLGARARQVSAGLLHTCALLDSGAVRCWGNAQQGQLGYGRRESSADVAAEDVNVGAPALRVVAAGFHSCALLDGGRLRCWGDNYFGQLGYGHRNSIGDDEQPASAGDVRIGEVVEEIVGGAYHTCARLARGRVRCWGWGEGGVLGYGSGNVVIGDDELPSAAGDVNLGGPAAQLAAGLYHTCAVLTDGTVRCWGKNEAGQLGYAHTRNIGDDETPANSGAVQVGGAVRQIAAGGNHTCALLTTGAVRCWGAAGGANVPELGYGNANPIGDNEHPSAAGDVNVGGLVSEIVTGRNHTCALLMNRKVRCWGDGFVKHRSDTFAGQLGYGNPDDIGDDELPSAAGDVPVQ